MKKFSILLLLALLSALSGELLYYLKDGFSARRVQSLPYPVAEGWDTDAGGALEQPFRYIGRGRQCFAFSSADRKYVLKLPRTDIYKTPFWVRSLPLPSYRARLEADHLERETFILNSFQLSASELKRQTALIALHLGQSAPSGKELTLIDALGCTHRFPLHKTPFILQLKQPILMQSFQTALAKGDQKEAERILDALLAVIVERASQGILNRDRSFLRNYGYDGQTAYQIDVGSFFRKPDLTPSDAYEKSIRDSTDPILEWLAQNAPHMRDYFSAAVQENGLSLKQRAKTGSWPTKPGHRSHRSTPDS
ncbi:MAG: hypothetical protein WCF19_04865 [Chlamydiales bacterium]